MDYSITDVYDQLVKAKVPEVPEKLISLRSQHITEKDITIEKLQHRNNEYSALIASFEQNTHSAIDTIHEFDDNLCTICEEKEM